MLLRDIEKTITVPVLAGKPNVEGEERYIVLGQYDGVPNKLKFKYNLISNGANPSKIWQTMPGRVYLLHLNKETDTVTGLMPTKENGVEEKSVDAVLPDGRVLCSDLSTYELSSNDDFVSVMRKIPGSRANLLDALLMVGDKEEIKSVIVKVFNGQIIDTDFSVKGGLSVRIQNYIHNVKPEDSHTAKTPDTIWQEYCKQNNIGETQEAAEWLRLRNEYGTVNFYDKLGGSL